MQKGNKGLRNCVLPHNLGETEKERAAIRASTRCRDGNGHGYSTGTEKILNGTARSTARPLTVPRVLTGDATLNSGWEVEVIVVQISVQSCTIVISVPHCPIAS
jgi:hypothetical protein